MSELKPCPFCGGDAALMPRSEQSKLIYNTGNELSTCYIVECKSCLSRMQRGFEEDAIKAWNTRPTTRDSELLGDINKLVKAQTIAPSSIYINALRRCYDALKESITIDRILEIVNRFNDTGNMGDDWYAACEQIKEAIKIEAST